MCSVLAAIVIEAYNKFFIESEKDHTGDSGNKTIKGKLVNTPEIHVLKTQINLHSNPCGNGLKKKCT